MLADELDQGIEERCPRGRARSGFKARIWDIKQLEVEACVMDRLTRAIESNRGVTVATKEKDLG